MGRAFHMGFVFGKNGKLLADSKRRPEGGGLETGDNKGCPASDGSGSFCKSIETNF